MLRPFEFLSLLLEKSLLICRGIKILRLHVHGLSYDLALYFCSTLLVIRK